MNGGPAALRLAAVDLGATSGRVMVATVAPPDRLDLEEVYRFENGPVSVHGHLRWDIDAIRREVSAGLRAAGPVDGIGIDSWAVDYGLLDSAGDLLGDPYSHRDARTDGVPERVLATLPEAELYATTGLQRQPFNTLYQLVSELPLPAEATTMLLIPDLLGHWLTGVVGAERTNASTTQLYDVRDRTWATALADRVGIPARILPALRDPGTVLGPLLPARATALGQRPGTPVVSVGSHDTASAVVALPLLPGTTGSYISSGTWSLVGVELAEPVLSAEARAANFTNEGGLDGTIRFLRNVMGLWVLSETMRGWSADGDEVDLPTVLAEASDAPPFGPVVDIDAPVFLPPGDMPARIAEQCARTGQESPT
ncbi:MAG: rhamnulokinase family protein, partial [Actinocatenispora sp.]